MTVCPKRRILIIDDQESIHHDYRKIIAPPKPEQADLAAVEAALFGNVIPQGEDERDLYDIASAFQGEEAVRLVKQALAEGQPYAVAFVDIRMPPGCDGIQTIRQMWEHDPDLLVVICSAYSDYCWEDIVRELGRTDRFLILRKPFESMEVRQCAAALTERWVVARTDALTGLLNRRAFKDQLHREWAHSVRDEQPLCCVMLDIDYFKTINDRFGHTVGDQVLQAISAVILEQKRPADAVCRYGGEEICVLMPHTSAEEGRQWSEAMRRTISKLPLFVHEGQCHVTASFGVSASSESTSSGDELVERADLALRHAKQAGRDRVVLWTPEDSSLEALQRHEYANLFANIQAREIMSTHVVCVRDDCTVVQAIDMLLQCSLNSAPVVDQHGNLLGLISEKDVMDALGSELSWSTCVADLMTTRVIQYAPETPAQIIFDFLCRVQLRRVIVVEAGKPVGVISRGCFLRWIKNHLRIQKSAGRGFDSETELLQTAESLLSRTTKLRDDLENYPDDVTHPLISGVSSIETLLGDLLGAGCSKTETEGEKIAECL